MPQAPLTEWCRAIGNAAPNSAHPRHSCKAGPHERARHFRVTRQTHHTPMAQR
jgi:hypothetical protein